MMTREQVIFLLERLKWEPIYEDQDLVLVRKRRSGYAADPEIAKIEAMLSLVLAGVEGR
jgi:hypothetical protein